MKRPPGLPGDLTPEGFTRKGSPARGRLRIDLRTGSMAGSKGLQHKPEPKWFWTLLKSSWACNTYEEKHLPSCSSAPASIPPEGTATDWLWKGKNLQTKHSNSWIHATLKLWAVAPDLLVQVLLQHPLVPASSQSTAEWTVTNKAKV